ncbi:hypothetical protein ACYZUC_05605 [Pseudomonas sp. GT1P32]
MSNKTPENKYELGAGSGQFNVDKSSNASDFFESCTSFEVLRGDWGRPDFRYPVDYRTGSMIVAALGTPKLFKLRMKAPLNSKVVYVFAPGLSNDHWYGYPNDQGEPVTVRADFDDRRIGKYVLEFSAEGATSSLGLFIVPYDLTYFTSYKLNGEDYGRQDLLLYYNEFYTLEFYNLEDENYKFLESSKIVSVSYPEGAPYDIDFIEEEELVENIFGKSSLDGLSSATNKTAKMTGGVKGLRVRYKNPDNPYFGPLDVTLRFQEGMVLKPPIEVVKRVEV